MENPPPEDTGKPPVFPRKPSCDNTQPQQPAFNDVKFYEICTTLQVDDETYKRALHFLTRMLRNDIKPIVTKDFVIADSDLSRVWVACSLYIASLQQSDLRQRINATPQQQTSNVSASSIKLTELLLVCNITLSDLFNNCSTAVAECIPRVANSANLSRFINSTITQLKHNYVVMTLLFKKFQMLWDLSRNFIPQTQNPSASGSITPSHNTRTTQAMATYNENSFRSAWLVFLIVRHEQRDVLRLDLAMLYKLLVAVVNWARFAPIDDETHKHLVITSSYLQRVKNEASDPAAIREAEVDAAKALISCFPVSDNAKNQAIKQQVTQQSEQVKQQSEQAKQQSEQVKQQPPQSNQQPPIAAPTTTLIQPQTTPANTTEQLPDTLVKLCRIAQLNPKDVKEMQPPLHEFVVNVASVALANTQNQTSKQGAALMFSRQLSTKATMEWLNKQYKSRFIREVCDFDETIYLEPRVHKQVTNTPLRKPPSKSTGNVTPELSKRRLFADAGNSASDPAYQTRGSVLTGLAVIKEKRGDMGPPRSPKNTAKASSANMFSSPSRSSIQRMSAHVYSSPVANMRPSPSTFGTPVSSAVEASNWLRREIGTSDGPGSKLKRYFAVCAKNPEQEILLRVAGLENALLQSANSTDDGAPSSSSSSRSTNPNNNGTRMDVDGEDATPRAEFPTGGGLEDPVLRRSLKDAKTIYFNTLESVLAMEEERLNTKSFGPLLNNDTFHRALYACAIEMVLCSKQRWELMYPASISVLDVSAFDLLKVLESFVKAMPSLPQMLRVHIGMIEENILESQAWKSGSGLFDLLELEKTGMLATQEKSKASSLALFLRKLFSLAVSRIKSLCMDLSLEGQFPNDVWLTVKHGLKNCWFLLKDRHLDHLILCSVYAVAKIKNDAQVTFKSIIRAYKNQRSGEYYSPSSFRYHDVIKEIVLGVPESRKIVQDHVQASQRKEEKGDVIKFYNRVFVPAMKSFVLQFQVKKQPDTIVVGPPGSPTPSMSGDQHMSSPSTSSRMRHTSNGMLQQSPQRQRFRNTNLWTSPMRTQFLSKSPSLTPRTRALYAFGESPARDLHVINRSVGSGSKRKSRLGLRQNLNLDDEDEQYAKRARISRVGITNIRKHHTDLLRDEE